MAKAKKNIFELERIATEMDGLISAVGYVRYSSTNQRSESNEEQKIKLNRYAEANGIKIVKIFGDDAVSGTSMKGRTGLDEMIRFIKENPNKIRYALFHKLDRLSRDSGDYYAIKKELKRYGVDMIFVSDGLNTENPECVLQESLLSGVAAYHSINLGREVMRGLEFNAENCMSTGGKPPLGYDIDRDTLKLVINETEAEIVKLIFRRFGEDGYSYAEIVDELNNKGYRTKRGNPFKKNSLTDLLKNEKYIGVYTYNKAIHKNVDGMRNTHKSKDEDQIIRIKDGCPRIISDDLWNKVQERRKNNNNSYSTRHFYPLKDKIYCGECNSKMGGNNKKSGSNKKRYPTYDCNNRKNKKCCTNKGINVNYIEQFVARQLRALFLNDKAIYDLANMLNQYLTQNHSSIRRSLDDTKRQLRIVREKINNIVSSVEGGRSLEPFKERLKDLDTQRTNLNARIELLTQQLNAEKVSPSELRVIREDFIDAVLFNDPLSRRVIQRYIHKVVIYQDRIEVILNSYRMPKRK